MISFSMQIKTVSEMNVRCHWSVRYRRLRDHRRAAKIHFLNSVDLALLKFPVQINLVRIGRRSLDTDNLAGSFKGIRDGLADAMRMDDADQRVSWKYSQEKGTPQSVRVEVTPMIEFKVAILGPRRRGKT